MVALPALIVAIGLAACGGGGGGGNADSLLKQTFSGHKPVHSGKIEVGLNLDVQGLPQLKGPVKLTLSGPFERQAPKTLPNFDFDLSVSATGQTFTAGAVSTGGRGFVKVQGSNYDVPAPIFATLKRSYAQAQSQRSGTPSNLKITSFGIDPRQWLSNAKVVGESDVAGAKTEHISADVVVPKLLDDINNLLTRAARLGVKRSQNLPTSLSAAARKQLAGAIHNATLDVYTGKDDKILRRLDVELQFNVPKGSRAGAQGLTGGRIGLTLQYSDLNQPQTIATPTNVRPFTELRGALSSLSALGLGGGAGSTAAGAAGGSFKATSPGATGGSTAAQAYLRCLQQAGGDLAKQQRCAPLLKQ